MSGYAIALTHATEIMLTVGDVIVVTNPPGAGKSTVAALLAERSIRARFDDRDAAQQI